MFDQYQICPYTGLRSFTEEESLYFKGREEHIEQATEQLQRNKFLMLTGASGDGKSSLVYAGIIPNARAGFLKSKYTSWCIADFRPERTPFKNLCKAVAKQLDIANAETVESELHHGFSALVDLYKNSKRFVDTDSLTWNNANDTGKAALKREAANLVIVVDQFEEFFTNPENYHRGVPSVDSNLVLNLLLETVRISLEEDLPIYVVFTMRSDYIGQCAAFRALPEYIGFSQFFVPRLNRSQLQQVIEEPAVLSGNRITRRLTERLIHDIADGVDQLPILQHALNQIWHAATQGTEEMDLIHYAMVGGMRADELPEEHQTKFQQWFEQLPQRVKDCYLEPNLQNVLDTHANKLFESASEDYKTKTGKEISDAIVKEIIKKAFTCLTKIDQSRAVRNRMTLKEIWNILNLKDVDIDTVGGVLNIFREPGNTFVRPFITEDTASGKLSEDDVLDITHESLIRNWELLDQWAKEEFNNYTISLDFEQQLNRWVENNKSNDFLLSIGPLTYFENWYDQLKPNAWWIARYLPEDTDQEKKIKKAEFIQATAKEFFQRSARAHIVTRSIIKYGPKRIAAVLALIAVLVLSSFGVINYLEQQNSFVLKKIKNESIQLAGDRKVAIQDKSILLCENVRLGLTTIPEIAKGIDDPIERVNAIASMGTAMVVQGWHEPQKEIYQSLATADSLLGLFPVSLSTPRYSDVLREINELMVTLDFAYYFNPSEPLKKLVQSNAKHTAAWLLLLANEKPADFIDIKNLDMAIEHAINHNALSAEEINQLLSAISPFEKSKPDAWIQEKFARDILSERGFFNYAIAYNGLYQELAHVYASQGNSSKALQCLDTLLKYNQKYHENDYSHMPDNAYHIAATFYRYNQPKGLEEFVSGYCLRKKIKSSDFYRLLTGYARVTYWTGYRVNYLAFMNRFSNLNLALSDENQLNFFFSKYRSSITSELKDSNERNFYLALSYKDLGINKSLIQIFRSRDDQNQTRPLFDSAFFYYKKVGKDFLNKNVLMYNEDETHPLKYLFLFPDFNAASYPSEPRGAYLFYSGGGFLQYILSHQRIEELYPTDEELKYIEDWLTDYRIMDVAGQGWMRKRISAELISKLEKQLQSHKGNTRDFSELYLLLGEKKFKNKQYDSSKYYYEKVNTQKILNFTSGPGPVGNYTMYHTASALADLALTDAFDKGYRFIQVFKKPVNRSSLYAFAAQQLMLTKIKSPAINRLIDSSRAEMLRVENTGVDQQSRVQVPFALAMRLDKNDLTEANKVMKNVSFKFAVQQLVSRSIAFNNQIYQAYKNTPETVSSTDKTVFLWNILYGYSEGMENQPEGWNAFEDNYRPWYKHPINYDDENK
ncbi:MAG TPA: hypothetical protein DGG95_01370 [Cytophagales bacterium]|jgi:hypothetical protein|nr:hypothetical protein [Cytophagales bacterium]